MGTPLLPLLGGLDPHRFGDGSRALPHRRLERLCRLTAEEEYTLDQVARALRASTRTVTRARAHPIVRARLGYLRHQVAERAAEDSPLAKRGNRIKLLDELARDLRQHLIDNSYTTTIAVDKQGVPIEGFDRGRVAELVKTVLAIHDMTTEQASTPSTTNVGVSVTMTTEQAVTRVQALLSRVEDHAPRQAAGGDPPSTPGGWRGVCSERIRCDSGRWFSKESTTTFARLSAFMASWARRCFGHCDT
jgi:hypothetical protein